MIQLPPPNSLKDRDLQWGLVLPDASALGQVPAHITAVLRLEQLESVPALPAHRVIVRAPELCVQTPDFAAQLASLKKFNPDLVVVSYYNAFDSDW